jgi:hypothetical protein
MRELIENFKNKTSKFLKESKEKIALDVYSVVFHTDYSSDTIYLGVDGERAQREFDTFNINDVPEKYKNETTSVQLSKKTDYYSFVYELEDDETIEDYPIEDYYDDSRYYKRIFESEFEDIETKVIEPVNKETDELLSEVQFHYRQKYGRMKYNVIDVLDDDDEYIGDIQLRITDHTENIHNIDRFGKHTAHLSVVIADYNATKQRFWANDLERRRNEIELYFNSENSFEEIVSEIDGKIEELKNNIKNEH